MAHGPLGSGRWRCTLALLSASFVLCPASRAPALEPTRAITLYAHDIWTSQHGLGEAAYQIVRSRDDYLWLRTSKGLVRFDGMRFTEPLADSACMDEPVLTIGMTTRGQLFARGSTKTCVLREGRFESLPTKPLPDGLARVAYQARDGGFWIGADSAIYRVAGDRLVQLRNGTGWIDSFLEDRQGTIWVGGHEALYQFGRDGTLVRLLELANSAASALLEDRRGHLWVGTRRGLYGLAGERLVEEPAARELRDRLITALLEDRDGNVWIGTDRSGLYRLTSGQVSSFTRADGLLDNEILSLAEDDEGSLWVGTRGGLERFRDTSFTPVTIQSGLAGDDVSTVVETRDGGVFAFSEGSGVTRLKDGAATVYGAAQGLPSLYGGILYAARDGTLWVSTLRGLSRLDRGRFTTYAPAPLGRLFVSAIGEDDEGLIVATAEPALLRFKDGSAHPLTVRGRTAPLPTSGNYVYSIYRATDGSLWFGSVRGLYHLTSGQLSEARQPGIDFPVTCIYDDGAGSLWLGARNKGLTRLRIQDGQVTRYTAQEGLFDDEVTSVLGDDQGRLWLSCRRGIFSVSRQELTNVAEGRRRTVSTHAYGIPDGMKSTETSDHQPAAARGPDGRLWFTTRRGLVLIDPARLQSSGAVPPVRLEEVVVDQRVWLPRGELDLRPGTEDLQFHYTALSLLIPERIRFKYQLEGYDRGWIDAGPRRTAYYTKLRPGRYSFRVEAATRDGRWSEPGAVLRLTLRPRFYQTRWFWLALGALLAAALAALHRLRVAQLRSRQRELACKVEERTAHLQREIAEHKLTAQRLATERDLRQALMSREVLAEERSRIARELHDSLAQNFAGVALQLESVAIDLPRRARGPRASLRVAARMLHHCQTEARRAVWDLRSHGGDPKSLQQLLDRAVAPLQHGGAPRIEVHVDGEAVELRPAARRHLVRIVQEAVTNAATHARASRVSVACRVRPEALWLEVSDDGQGFECDAGPALERGHFGLLGMQERAAKLAGSLEIVSRPGAGTCVRLRCPAVPS